MRMLCKPLCSSQRSMLRLEHRPLPSPPPAGMAAPTTRHVSHIRYASTTQEPAGSLLRTLRCGKPGVRSSCVPAADACCSLRKEPNTQVQEAGLGRKRGARGGAHLCDSKMRLANAAGDVPGSRCWSTSAAASCDALCSRSKPLLSKSTMPGAPPPASAGGAAACGDSKARLAYAAGERPVSRCWPTRASASSSALPSRPKLSLSCSGAAAPPPAGPAGRGESKAAMGCAAGDALGARSSSRSRS